MSMNIENTIEPIKPIVWGSENLYSSGIKKTDSSDTFEKLFKSALNLIDETNSYQLEAENLQTAYVTGESDDLIGLNLAQAKASSALSFTTQVTNKILTAYQEIMRISL